jgi:putative membrane protein
VIGLALALNAAAYLAGVRAASRPWPLWRTTCFLAGLTVLAVALVSPLHARAETSLPDHMAQHLLLVLVAAPLLVLGAPVALALRALHGSARRGLGAVVSSAPARALVHPLAGWLALAATTVGTHMTGWYDLAVRDAAVHGLEHVAFLAGALVWWTSLIGVHPGHSTLGPIGRLAWLMAAMPIMAGVGAWLAGAEHVIYPAYGSIAAQKDAGSMMWGLGALPMAFAAFGLAIEGLLREERRQRRREQLRGVRT